MGRSVHHSPPHAERVITPIRTRGGLIIRMREALPQSKPLLRCFEIKRNRASKRIVTRDRSKANSCFIYVYTRSIVGVGPVYYPNRLRSGAPVRYAPPGECLFLFACESINRLATVSRAPSFCQSSALLGKSTDDGPEPGFA